MSKNNDKDNSHVAVNIAMLNVRSVLTRSKVIDKPIALNELVSKQNYDIFVMIETWLRCKGDDASIVEMTPPNYTFIHTPRPVNSKTSRGGGVGMMYRNDMYKAKTLPMLDDIRTLELDRLQISSTSGPRFCVYTVYHPPRGTKLSGTETEFYSDLDILFTETSISTIPVIILGDFNIHFNDEHSSSKLRNMLNDYQMQQHVHSATQSSLWHKVLSHNMNGKLFNVIHTMYSSAKACIKAKNTRGNLFIREVGLRQGDNLSTLLFSIYLNDFELFLSKYYDGITFNCVNENDIYLHLHLYTLLYAVFSFCKLWYLELNISKTKVIIFTRGKVRKHIKFAFDGTELEVVDQYTYLGVTFNYNNTFYKSISRQISQAKKAMFSLIIKSRRLDVPIDITLDLFDKLVLPILIYGSEVWGHSNLKPIEIFYRNFIRRLLKLGESTSNCMLYGETGKTSIQPIIEKRMISFWLRLTQNKPQRLILCSIQFHNQNAQQEPI